MAGVSLLKFDNSFKIIYAINWGYGPARPDSRAFLNLSKSSPA